MVEEALIMGMPVSIEIVDKEAKREDIFDVFDYFKEVDAQFSTYKSESEVMKINRGEIKEKDYSSEMKKVLALCAQTRKETQGYFDIYHDGFMDPSGLVKGYAIWNGAKMLTKKGYKNYFVEIAGDIQTSGHNGDKLPWRVGIENPFNRGEIIKVVGLSGQGIATSGTYIRGKHIYNPKTQTPADEIASITVIGENVYEADRFATAAFAAGETGIELISSNSMLSAYMVTKSKNAVKTNNFEQYEIYEAI